MKWPSWRKSPSARRSRLTKMSCCSTFPLTLRFQTKTGAVDRLIQVTRKQEDFYFPLASAPERVRVDPDYTLLAKIKFSIPQAMLYAQLADQSRRRWPPAGDRTTVRQAGQGDPWPSCRIRSTTTRSTACGSRPPRPCAPLHTDEALEALLASTKQSDARVRRQVADAIGGFYADKAFAAAREMLREEKNPDILSTVAAQFRRIRQTRGARGTAQIPRLPVLSQ